MATIPQLQNLTGTSIDILNAIRTGANTDYKNYVPIATGDSSSIKEIGTIIMDNVSLQNTFIDSLINRIARVIITSKMYTNPLAMFKKGVIELGETVEEVFVNLATPIDYNPELAESEVFKRVIPDVKTAFHVMNYQKQYKLTVQQNDLRQAFLSWGNVTDFIAKLVDSMYTGASYDEFLTIKYLLARHILQGQCTPISTVAPTATNATAVVTDIKTISNDFEFLSTDYNIAGVRNNSLKNEQYMLVSSNFDAIMDVNVLASAFNMDKAEFLGHKVLIDGFGKLDIARLNELFSSNPYYIEPSQDEMDALNTIPAVIVDKDFFMLFDNLTEFTEIFNAQGLYWNYFYNCWKTFSVSPFANNAVFISGTPSITDINVSPSTANILPGYSLQMSVDVETENFAPQSVKWSINVADTVATISETGLLTVLTGATGTITVTATSTYDTTKADTATITIE